MGPWDWRQWTDGMDRAGARMVAELVGGSGVEVALSGCLCQTLNTVRSLRQEEAISESKPLDMNMRVVRYWSCSACMDAWGGSMARRCLLLRWRQRSIASAFEKGHPSHSTRPSHLLLIFPPIRYCPRCTPVLH